MKISKILNHWPILLVIALSNFLVLRYLNFQYPNVGHDYYYVLSRMLDIKLHYLINGLTIQWYTPSFGGGLPGFPNPISTQFSLPQFLYFFFDLWHAVEATVVLSSSVGIFFVYRLILKMNGDQGSATLGALFFALNGFTLSHLMAGHLPYHLFYFTPLLLYVFSLQPFRPFLLVAVTAVIYSLSLHSAGVQVIVALSFSATLCALFFVPLGLYTPNRGKRVLSFIGGVFLGVLISAAKLSAALSFMKLFSREIKSEVATSVVKGLWGIVYQLLGYPFFVLLDLSGEEILFKFMNINGNPFGLWEHDTFMPLVLFLLLALCLMVLFCTHKGQIDFRKWCESRWQQKWFFLGGFLVLWISIEMILAQGPWFSIIKILPVLKSLHVNVRFTSILVLPLAIAGALAFHYLTRKFISSTRLRNVTVFIVALLALANFSIYEYRTADDPRLESYDLSISKTADQEMSKGERFIPVSRVIMVRDDQSFSVKASSIKPYEPIFGYQLEQLKAQVKEGSLVLVDGERFNMTNPSSLVFPTENGLEPFARVAVQDKENMRAFVFREQPKWQISTAQKVANALSLVGILFLIICLVLDRKFCQSTKS